ncbi:MAG TPA: transporter, partial [Campylobacterales bacterium]|nr:transporter [Campylobacterales bacterium]
MNQLKATIRQIENIDNLNLLTLSCGKQHIRILTLELNPNLKVGSVVTLSLKSTDIAIAKNCNGILSYTNQLKAKITHLNNGKLLSSVRVDIEGFGLESIIMLDSSLKMGLRVSDEVVILIQGSDISICGEKIVCLKP